MKYFKLISILVFLLYYSSLSQVKLAEKDLVNFSTEHLLSLNRVSDPQVSPDGKWVLFTYSTPNIDENEMQSDLWAVSIDGSDLVQITTRPTKEYHGRWIEGGKKIAFLSSRMGSPQIFVKDFKIENAEAITAIIGGVGGFAYSPDGKYILYSSDVKIKKDLKDKYKQYRSFNAFAYDQLPVRAWDHWEDESFSHLFIISSTGKGATRDIMENEPYDCPLSPFGGTEDFAWSPDGKEIIYTCKKVENPAQSTNTDLYVYDVESKTTKNITSSNPGYDKNPQYSLDGKFISYISLARPGFEADKRRLMIYDRTLGTTKEISVNLDQWVEQFTWATDSKHIFFSATEKGNEPLMKINVETNKIDRIADGNFNYSSGIGVTPDGTKVIVGRTSMQEPTDFYTIDLAKNNEIKQITRVNSLVLIKIRSIEIEERMVKAKDGKEIHTFVLYPPNFDKTKKYPMITYCQGGPQGTISNYFSYRWNLYLMASQGYIVVAPNRRGMPGFGQQWNDEISKDWGGKAMSDILSATDNVSNESFVDKKNLFCVGPSYGGYSVFWLAGHHDKRFKAFISHCGVYNLTSMYGSTEELFFPNWEFGGPYWDAENKEQYEEFSPHNYVNNWDTPMLVITGQNDFRVPYTQSLEAFTALQVKGIKSKLLVFPTENHWVLGLQNAYVWHSEFFDWLKQNSN